MAATRAARRPRRAARAASASLSCSSSSRRTLGAASAADRRSGACPGRKREAPAAPGASGPRRISAAISSIEARVAPVQVVEHEHQRLGVGQQLQQRADRAVGAVALVGDAPRRRRSRAAATGSTWPSSSSQLGVPGLVAAQVLRGHVGVERVDPHAERHVALELGRGAGQHEVAALLGARAQLGQQPGLADARLALQRDARRRRPRRARRAPPRAAPSSASRPTVVLRAESHICAEPTALRAISGCRFRGAAPMFGGRPRRRLPPCSRTPTEGAPCKSRETSQRGPAAGAPGTARPPSSAGSCSWSWPSWCGKNLGTETLDAGPVGRGRLGPGLEDRRRAPTPTSTTSRCSSRARASRPTTPEYRAVVADVTKRLEDDEGRDGRSTARTTRSEQSADLGRRPFGARQLRDHG